MLISGRPWWQPQRRQGHALPRTKRNTCDSKTLTSELKAVGAVVTGGGNIVLADERRGDYMQRRDDDDTV